MAKPIMMRKRAKIVALIIFFIALIVTTYLGTWWPGIMLAVGIPLAILQYLQGRRYDMWISLFVFGGAFITVQLNIKWEYFLPVLFAIGGLYVFLREFLYDSSDDNDDRDQS